MKDLKEQIELRLRELFGSRLSSVRWAKKEDHIEGTVLLRDAFSLGDRLDVAKLAAEFVEASGYEVAIYLPLENGSEEIVA